MYSSLYKYFNNLIHIKDRISTFECLYEIDEYVADSSLLVYPTLLRSDYHTFNDSPWNSIPFMGMLYDYLWAFILWVSFQVGRFTGQYLARPMTYQEKLNFRELRAWGLTFLIWIVIAVESILIYFDDPQLYDLLGAPYYLT